MLKNKNILIGVSSSIAAYKVVDTIREIKQQGANVKVILTENAKKFVSTTVIETFLEEKVYSDLWQNPLDHINLARWCDAFLITPATANTICKLSVGIADNLLTNVFLACNKPKLIAPAMNTLMLESNQVANALLLLKKYNCNIIEPQEGMLACKEYGKGHIASNSYIIASLKRAFFGNKLAGKNVVITGGGTIEEIDPIRSINNKSTGYFAIALAETFYAFGANVEFIKANTSFKEPCYINTLSAKSANQMLEESLKLAKQKKLHYYVATVAVSDYFVKNKSDSKIKKHEGFNIELGLNKDIVQTIANLKENRPLNVVGFCAETGNEASLKQSALNKLKNKNLNYIVANNVGSKLGFGKQNSSVYILANSGNEANLQNLSKKELAYNIVEFVTKGNANEKT